MGNAKKNVGGNAANLLARATRATAGLVDTGETKAPVLTSVPVSSSPTGVALKQRTLPLDMIEPDTNQPRHLVDDAGIILEPEKMASLVESIAAHGVVQPILVRPVSGDRFRIIAGERRWRAAHLAGQTHIPVAIYEGGDADVLALMENTEREDLGVLEIAAYLRRIKAERGISQDELASLVGRDKSYISRMLAVLELPERILRELSEHNDKLSMKLLSEITGAGDEETKIALWEHAKRGVSANDLRRMKGLPAHILDDLAANTARVPLSSIAVLLKAETEDEQEQVWEGIKAGLNSGGTPAVATEKPRLESTTKFVNQVTRFAKQASKFRATGAALSPEQIDQMKAARAELDELIREAHSLQGD